MSEDQCKVSVIVPAYNSADYTVETVESILAQTYTDYEILVIDDGSTDHTRETLAPYGDRIKYIYKENGGACSARNLGLEMSQGEYIACLDCDDLWLPEKLEKSVAVLDADPMLAFVFSRCYTIDAKGDTIDEVGYSFDPDDTYRCLLYENYVIAPTVLMRRACLDRVGCFDESIFIPADWDLWLRLAKHFPIASIDCPLSKYRLASNYTLRNVEQCIRESAYVIEKQFQAAPELLDTEKRRIKGCMLVTNGMFYRKLADAANARSMLGRAIRMYPYDWRPYVHFFLSLFGCSAWNTLANSKRAVRFRAIVTIAFP